jgi:hypothetical protein
MEMRFYLAAISIFDLWRNHANGSWVDPSRRLCVGERYPFLQEQPQSKGDEMTKQEVLNAANVMIAYANGKKVGTRPTRSMEPLLEILYVPTWNWEQKEYFVIPDDCSKELENDDQSKAHKLTEEEQRILFLAESPDCNHPRELRAIAFQVRKLEDRIKQLESENDALRADLLLWEEKEAKP